MADKLLFKRAQMVALAALFTITSFATANAASKSNKQFSNIKISNFGQMTEHLYRGAQPGQEDYKDLASLGIKVVIDLRNDPKPYAKSAAEAAGMRYINIPMSDKKRPQDEQIDQFLAITKDLSQGPFYIHCAGGRHRTGVMGAMYRYTYDNWNYEQVYKEMKAFDYYSRWGHGALGDYVEDYYTRIVVNAHTNTGAAGSSNPNQ